jgi:O-antigen/teichoic acid export membrane protein
MRRSHESSAARGFATVCGMQRPRWWAVRFGPDHRPPESSLAAPTTPGPMPGFRRSVMFSMIDRYAALVLNLVGTAVLARLLTPAEFGVVMVSVGIVAVVEAAREFGVGAFLVQTRDLSSRAMRTAFTVSLALSVLLAAAVLAAADYTAWWYGDPRVAVSLRLITISFLLVPFCGTVLALLRREMAFDRVAVINVTGAGAQMVVAVILAMLGFGYLSLALGAVGSSAAMAAAAVACGPGLSIYRPCLTGWRSVLSFGGWASGTMLLNTLYVMQPQLCLGRFAGFEAAGLFNRAMMLCQLQDRLVLGVLSPVLLPALSARVRGDQDLKDAYLRGAALGLTVQWPFLGCLALLADPIVQVLLGTQWSAAAVLVRIISLASLSMFPAFLTYPVLVATGRVKDTFTASLIALPPSFILVFAASWFGAEAVAATSLLTLPLQLAVALHFVRRQVRFTWPEFIAAIRPGAGASILAVLVPTGVIMLAGFRFDIGIGAGAAAGAGAVVGWLVGLALVRHPLLQELRALGPFVSAFCSRSRRQGPEAQAAGFVAEATPHGMPPPGAPSGHGLAADGQVASAVVFRC